MTANAATFTNPNPTMAVLTALTTALAVAEAGATTKAKGLAAIRDAKWLLVESGFALELAYVQVLADNAGPNATMIFEQAGMSTTKVGARPPRGYKASQKTSGTVSVTAPRTGDGTSTIWEWGTNPGALSSTLVTIHPKISITNQVPGTLLYVRHRTVNVKGYTDWSQTISILVT